MLLHDHDDHDDHDDHNYDYNDYNDYHHNNDDNATTLPLRSTTRFKHGNQRNNDLRDMASVDDYRKFARCSFQRPKCVCQSGTDYSGWLDSTL